MIEEVIAYAKSKIGFKELKGNMGFEDPVFDTIMRQNGFQDSWAWCMLFAKSCYTVPTFSGKSKVLPAVDKAFTPGAVKSYQNAASDVNHFKVSKIPSIGDVVIWQNYKDGKPHWTGHAGIVSHIDDEYPNLFHSIEGNTNSEGGREGIEVAEMRGMTRHDTLSPKRKNGLNILGFITVLN